MKTIVRAVRDGAVVYDSEFTFGTDVSALVQEWKNSGCKVYVTTEEEYDDDPDANFRGFVEGDE